MKQNAAYSLVGDLLKMLGSCNSRELIAMANSICVKVTIKLTITKLFFTRTEGFNSNTDLKHSEASTFHISQ